MSSPASSILREAAETIENRAVQRDSQAENGNGNAPQSDNGGKPQERSMARCVAAFNGLTRHTLSETEGWMFMAILKMARAQNGSKFVRDDYVDGAAYMALAGESAEGVPELVDEWELTAKEILESMQLTKDCHT